MKLYAAVVLSCAALCAGEDVILSPRVDSEPILMNIGDVLPFSVFTGMLDVNDIVCELKTPTKTIQLRPNNYADPEKFSLRDFNILAGCAVDVTITDKSDEGSWRLLFTPLNGGVGAEQEHHVVVNASDTTTAIYEESTYPTTEYEVEREIEYLFEEFFNINLGKRIEVKINHYDFVHTESCHIITPEGHEYKLQDFDRVKVIENHNTACGIEMTVDSDDLIGNWTLFSRDTRYGNPIERRLNFTIHVEETVKASPERVTVTKGSDVYIHLANPTVLHSTCVLVQPNYNAEYERDESRKEECGFVIRNIQENGAGLWKIEFGETIIYRAFVKIDLNAALEQQGNVEWTIDSRIDQVLGPASTTYCRIRDHTDRVWFEGFGRCHITVDRVTQALAGIWTLDIGTSGRVLTDEQSFTVNVRQAVPRPRVITHVEKHRPEVLLTCGLEGQHTINSCKFRDPSGRILIANEGVGEDRYSYLGTEVSLSSSVTNSECGLRITNPLTSDLGLWRCAIETSEDVYYGHLTVICPFVISQPNAPEIQTEPLLTASRMNVEGVEGEAVTMDCSVQSEIRYCYFRARNGTVFSVSPSTNTPDVEYAGAGFDAGDCSIRFRNLEAHDTGAWSCHVGFKNNAAEQRASFSVNIQRPITVNQAVDGHTGRLIVSAQIYNNRAVDYCRYVRIDGLGFDARNPPTGYTSNAGMGPCWISIANPTMLDHHPWTIAARISGQDVEVYGSSDHTITMPTTAAPPHPPHPEVIENEPEGTEQIIIKYTSGGPGGWVLLSLLIVTIVLLLLNMFSKKHRQWARNSACAVRNSFRRNPTTTVPPPEYEQKTQVSV